MNNEDLVKTFQSLKTTHDSLVAERMKYETRKEQLELEIKSLQEKYSKYDLSTIESVEKIIEELQTKLTSDLALINKQYEKIKSHAIS